MRSFVVFSLGFAFVGVLGAQSIAEYGAAAAGGATGGAAGKKVSEGISTIFGKVDKQAAEAAKQGKPAAPPAATPITTPETAPAASVPSAPKPAKALREKPAVAKSMSKSKSADKDDGYDMVPPPPPIQRVAIGKPTEVPPRMASLIPQMAPAPAQPVAPPPPPPVTADRLRTLAPGTNREDVLKLGTFASRITMIDNGHLAETYRYPVGVVRVSDGVVAAVEVQ